MGRPAVVPIADLRTYRKRYVTPAQLADYIGVTRQMIYQEIRKGALPVRRIGGVVRILKDDAMAYVGEDPIRKDPAPLSK